MTEDTALVVAPLDANVIEFVLLQGDLSRLKPAERVAYYNRVCESLGLNPLTKPFDYLTLNGKTVLYAKRDATEQLRKIHGVSIVELSSREVNGVFVVTAKAQDARQRIDVSTGAVPIAGLKGEALANALMKAETKAKRRVTLSICGLGLLDETEVETIPRAAIQASATTETVNVETGEIVESKASAPKAERAPAGQPSVPNGADSGTSSTAAREQTAQRLARTLDEGLSARETAKPKVARVEGVCVSTTSRQSSGQTVYDVHVEAEDGYLDDWLFSTLAMDLADHAARFEGQRVAVRYEKTRKGGNRLLSIEALAVTPEDAFMVNELPAEATK